MIGEGVTFSESPREAIQASIADFDITVDYGALFGDQHDPRRAKATTQALLEMLTRGKAISAEYSNPLGHKAVADYEVPATWAIGHALETLSGNIYLPGEAVNERGKIEKGVIVKPAIERNSSLLVTPIRKDGKRLVTKRANDGNTHILEIYWMPENTVQGFIEAEIEHDRQQKDSR